MPSQLAVFPKCFLDDLIVHRTLTLFDWIEMASSLPYVQGLELYPPLLDSFEPADLRRIRAYTEERGLTAPMMCASPDFIRREPAARDAEVEHMRLIIEAVALLGGRSCRVLSGQRIPGVGREEGIAWVVECIEQLLPYAEAGNVVLVLENHYKDGYWKYPEFAQRKDIFLEILNGIDSPWLGVNYDPSNAIIAGDDPYELLDAVKHRLVSMHASDRSLEGGTLEDLRRMDADPMTGYAPFIKHGVIGKGLVDYDRIFQVLVSIGFSGWISIEDGQDPDVGMEHLRESALFLHWKMVQYGLA